LRGREETIPEEELAKLEEEAESNRGVGGGPFVAGASKNKQSTMEKEVQQYEENNAARRNKLVQRGG